MGNSANKISQLAEADLAQQALMAATQVTQTVGQTAQFATKNASETFNRFVEGGDARPSRRGEAVEPEKRDFWDSFGAAPAGPSKDKQDFWDSFGASPEPVIGGALSSRAVKPATVGTAAMKKSTNGSGSSGTASRKDGQEDEWGEW